MPSPASNKRSTSASFLERRLGSLSISRRGGEPLEQTRGPLGLNLLWEPSEPRIDFIFVSFNTGISISMSLYLTYVPSHNTESRETSRSESGVVFSRNVAVKQQLPGICGTERRSCSETYAQISRILICLCCLGSWSPGRFTQDMEPLG